MCGARGGVPADDVMAWRQPACSDAWPGIREPAGRAGTSTGWPGVADDQLVVSCGPTPGWTLCLWTGTVIGIGGGVVLLAAAAGIHDSRSVPLLVIGGGWLLMGLSGVWQLGYLALQMTLDGGTVKFRCAAREVVMAAREITGIRWPRWDPGGHRLSAVPHPLGPGYQGAVPAGESARIHDRAAESGSGRAGRLALAVPRPGCGWGRGRRLGGGGVMGSLLALVAGSGAYVWEEQCR